MTSSELYNFLYSQAPGILTVRMDGNYALPTRRWVLNEFAKTLDEEMQFKGVGKYKKDAFDCDNYAGMAWQHAQVLHARTSPNSGKGLAFGMWCYTTRHGGGHAINFAVVLEDGQPQLMFFEPQTGKEVQLIREEKVGATAIV